jgi:hypothetical protein
MQASSSAAGGPRAQAFQLRSAAVIVDETGDTVLPSSSNGLFRIGEGSTKSAFDDGEEPTSKVVLNAEVPFGAIVCGMPVNGLPRPSAAEGAHQYPRHLAKRIL